ncbi:MAG: squalene/phytoene synthase family protein [Methylobacteriaceae bacterium]|nr:squalene/phytoene synthase family protein [Methylobacteriaceae bacterium]MBV9394872.1 squalene/phytoene synthase family protein [Methylobacteriaceae bacterium]
MARAAEAGSIRAAPLAAHYEYCGTLVREHDRDRWLASLFAPAEKRPHLHALYGFNIEIARIPQVVSDPMPGEIRMQWWSEALEDAARGDVVAHPVADAFLDTVAKCGLPQGDFAALIEARRFDLYHDPMPDMPALITYCDATASCLFSAAAQILAGEKAAKTSHAAGIAYAITGLLRALPFHTARGQCFVPADLLARYGMSPADILAWRDTPDLRAALGELRTTAGDHLAQARASVDSLGIAARPAFMPVAVLRLYLAAMERPDYDPFTVTEVPQWQRQWRLWRESRAARPG